jgi:3-methylcrotonyl-CoA carboxylase beta subunit
MDNQQEIQMLNMELSENVEQSMQLTREEEGKLVKRKKFDARDRIRKLLDRGSPWLALG